MGEERDKKSFWVSIPGILTGLAALIAAIGSIWLNIPAPEIVFFEANPNSITVGDSAKLSWSVSHAQCVSIIDTAQSVSKNFEANGNCTVYPKNNTTYALRPMNWFFKEGKTNYTDVVVLRPAETNVDESPEAIGAYSPENPKCKALLRRQLEYQELYNETVDILENQNKYLLGRGVTEKSLRETQDELQNGIIAIQKTILKCAEENECTCDMPEKAESPDYEFRIRMPIMLNYTSEINIFVDENDLRNYISEVWIEDISNDRNMHGQEGLNNEQIDDYKSRIEVNKPPQSIYLKHVSTGKYLAFRVGGKSVYIEPSKYKTDDSCEFNVTVLSPNKIAMEADNGKYLVRGYRINPLDKNHHINSIEATKTNLSGDCVFAVKSLDDGTVTFRADNGKYWRDTTTKHWTVIDASGDGIDDRCKFLIIDSRSDYQA